MAKIAKVSDLRTKEQPASPHDELSVQSDFLGLTCVDEMLDQVEEEVRRFRNRADEE